MHTMSNVNIKHASTLICHGNVIELELKKFTKIST